MASRNQVLDSDANARLVHDRHLVRADVLNLFKHPPLGNLSTFLADAQDGQATAS